MELKCYEKEKNVVDTAVFGGDAITFSVLKRIVNNCCDKVLTDGRRAVICHSQPPYPVWVWAASDAPAEELARCLEEHFPPRAGYAYNLSYGLLERLRACSADIAAMGIRTNMLTYRCDALALPERPCGGCCRLAETADIPQLAGYMLAFCREAESNELSAEDTLAKIAAMTIEKRLFVWEDGGIKAMASRADDGAYSRVSGVYTVPQARRKGYALHLVGRLTANILADGLIPILYTDSDYAPSNACYQKLGYRQVGSLCSVKL